MKQTTFRQCSTCRKLLPETSFHINRSTKDGLNGKCKPCACAYTIQIKAKYRGTPKGRADYRRNWLKRYGLDEADYARMLQEQASACATCGAEFRSTRDTCIDHCHASGAVRGLLCRWCNLAIGYATDNPTRLKAMARYLDAARAAT